MYNGRISSIFLFKNINFDNNNIGGKMIINNSKIQNIIKENSKDKNKRKKVLLSFVFGCVIGVISQGLYIIFNEVLNIKADKSSILSSMTMVFLSFLLTGFSIFDKFALLAYSGAIIPITGFANSITSSALEGKSEGLILGIGSKIFSLVGSVFTYGVVSSILLGFIYYLLKVIENA